MQICNAKTQLFRTASVGWLRVATGSFKLHLLRQPMEKTYRRRYSSRVGAQRCFYSFEDIHLSAFISSCGSAFVVLPHAKLPRLALTNLLHLHVPPTPLPVLQPSPKPSDGELKPETHLREPLFPFWGRCRRMYTGQGICTTALAALGGPSQGSQKENQESSI